MDKCLVTGCQNPIKRMDMCYGHYMKNWRYGTPTPEHPARWDDLRGQRYGTLTVKQRTGQQWLCTCDCGNARLVSAGELNRTGDANTCGVKANHLSDDVDYTAAHGRVRRERGPASKYPCVDCGTKAKHWSYDHADPHERTSRADRTFGTAFSLNIEHYEPRCVPCHKRFDLSHINGTRLEYQ